MNVNFRGLNAEKRFHSLRAGKKQDQSKPTKQNILNLAFCRQNEINTILGDTVY